MDEVPVVVMVLYSQPRNECDKYDVMASFRVSRVLLQLDLALMGPNSVHDNVNSEWPNDAVLSNFSNADFEASQNSEVNNSTSGIDFKLTQVNS